MTLIPITAGIVIASGAEADAHFFGCIACLTATAMRALKTIVQAMLLTDTAQQLDSMSLLVYICNVSAVLLAGATIVFEPGAFGTTVGLVRQSPAMLGWILANACLAYAVNLHGDQAHISTDIASPRKHERRDGVDRGRVCIS